LAKTLIGEERGLVDIGVGEKGCLRLCRLLSETRLMSRARQFHDARTNGGDGKRNLSRFESSPDERFAHLSAGFRGETWNTLAGTPRITGECRQTQAP